MNAASIPTSLAQALAAASDTHCLDIAAGNIAATARVFQEQFGTRAAVIVADRNTWDAAGARAEAVLVAASCPMQPPFIFEAPELAADMPSVDQLQHALAQHGAVPIAVGSGTINDVTKLAAHRTQRPYMCVATAASMDGYTAFGASITWRGSKQTFQCPAPIAVLADLDVICHAPAPMNAAGYGDLLAKVTAGADWILADALGVDPIDDQAWGIVQGRLRDLLANPAGIPARDPVALGRLVEGLMLGGFAMQAHTTSRPASGAEHQFSHLWDMQRHQHRGHAPSHGFKVGVATLAVTALYEGFLRLPIERLDIDGLCATWPDTAAQEASVRKLFAGADFIDKAVQETLAKAVDAGALRAQLQRLRDGWPQLKARLAGQLLPFQMVREMLAAAGAPTTPQQIGLTPARLRASFLQACHIRRRCTILDVVLRTGTLDTLLDQQFGAAGVWAQTGPPAGCVGTA